MRFFSLLLCLLLLACSQTPLPIETTSIQLDLPAPLHHPGHGLPDEAEIYALPKPAQELLDKTFHRYRYKPHQRLEQFQQWMAKESGFRVLYDNDTTFIATDTYAKGVGNCMSLAILTTAFARYLKLYPHYSQPDVPLFWEQREGLETVNDHINVVVKSQRGSLFQLNQQAFIVDFSSESRFRYANSVVLSEQDALALFYRNRAAEALVRNQLDLAYSYGYQVVKMQPQAAGSYSLMGVILRRQGHVALAERSYLKGVQLNSSDSSALHNLAYLYSEQGRGAEAQPYYKRLEQQRLKSPFVIARKAEQYYKQGDYEAALRQYRKAIRKADYVHDFHFGAARSLFLLGHYKAAKQAMKRAIELSTTQRVAEKYSHKLAVLSRY